MTGRVGLGFDVHGFSSDPARRLILGGVEVEGARGLAGHSDGDVIAHSLADALLGAAGLGDIGEHFPDTDPALSGADSMTILGRVTAMVADAGWRPVNADCTVVLEAPMLAPYRSRLVDRLGAVLAAPVSVKAKRPEGLGSLGRAEGIACMAVVLLESRVAG
jgi:2-C-methyl-D-erythritol 2,4-cyclodiphosphate synthase